MRNIALLSLITLATALLSGIGDAGINGKGETEAGAAIFHKYCLRCHGAGGKGDGPASRILKTKPHDLTDRAYMSKQTDEELFHIIAQGGAAAGKSKLMPAYEKKLNKKEVQDLVAFIRSLAGE